MADITWPMVVAGAPDLSAVDVLEQADILTFANGFLDKRLFGGEESPIYKRLRVLLARHMGAQALAWAGSGVSGPVTSESEGGVSRSYAAPQWAAADRFGSTVYGQQFSALLNMTAARAGLLL